MLEGQAVSGCTGARATPICWRVRLSLAVLVPEPLLYAGGSGCLWLYWCPSHSYMLEGQAGCLWLYWCPSHSYMLEGQADSGCTGVRATPICWRVRLSGCTGARATPICWRVRLSLAVLVSEPLLYAGGSGCLWLYWCPSHSYMLEGQAVSGCTGVRATPICWRVRLSLVVLVSEPLLYAGGSGCLAVLVPEPLLYAGGSGCLWLYWCPSHSYMLEGQAVSGCTGARATPICWRVRLSGCTGARATPICWRVRLSLAVLVPEPLLYAGGSGCLWLYWCPSHSYMLEGQAVWLYWCPSHSYMLEGQAVSGCTGARATPICWRVRLSLAVLVPEPLLYAGGSGCLWLYWCPSHSYMLEGQAVSGCTGARATPICWRVRLSGCTGARATPICWRVRLSLAVLVPEPLLYAGGSGCLWLYWCPSHSYMLEGQAVWLYWCPSHSYMLEGQAVSGCTGARATPICWRVRLSLAVLVPEPLLYAGGSGCLAVLVPEPLLYAGGSGCLWLYWCPSHSYMLEGQAVSGCTGVRATPICWRVRLSLAVLVPEPLLYAGGSGCLWLYWCPSHSYMLEGQADSGCTGA